jgi:tRNA-dihydrouridine synthase
MQYAFAPMEGVTDRWYRNAHHRFFPGIGSPDVYYAPFLSPTKDHVLIPRKWQDILPENNPGLPLVPQLLTKNAEDFLWMTRELAALGYREVNLNLGCPAGTVVAKGKGAGFLRAPEALDAFLDAVYAASPVPVSIKTRLGIEDPAEFGPLLEIFNRYPVSQLIIHPRVQKQLYRGDVHREAFEQALRESRAPVCYNGSLNTAGDCAAFAAAHPQVCGIMLGRGFLANPALLRQLRGGSPPDAPTLEAFYAALYETYAEAFGSRKNAVRRMKALWAYLLCLFDQSGPRAHQLRHQLYHLTEPWEYEATARALFAALPLRQDAEGVT